MEYICLRHLDLYDSPQCEGLATQAAMGRHLQIISPQDTEGAIEVRLAEDGYRAWLPSSQLEALEPTVTVYQPPVVSRGEIAARIPQIIAFMKAAMAVPNIYLWGGTVAPNYDCSGLMQAAFAASGIWLPRDSYQQAGFTQRLAETELVAGDLIFFAAKERVSHVALYLGEGNYIHSSGKDIGRNGIGIDRLSPDSGTIGQNYYRQLWGFGRVMESMAIDI
jgi:cell wall-associated NlpC family hydrolase